MSQAAQRKQEPRRRVDRNTAAQELAKPALAVLNALRVRVMAQAEKATQAIGGSVMSNTQKVVSEVTHEQIVDWIDEVTHQGRKLLSEGP